MTNFLDKCEQYFGSRDFYEVLQVNKDCNEKTLKKAYHKLSLLVHPDRVDEKQKVAATEKFKVLGRIYSILQDADNRKAYDETGYFDEEGESNFDWVQYWKAIFKTITITDIQNAEKNYIGSETEIRDIKKAYVGSKGDMNMILELVPFSNCDNEPRYIEIVQKMVDDGEVERYERFFNESARKRERRWAKWAAEAEETKDVDLELLQQKIQENQEKRLNDFASMMNNIVDKYTKPAKKRQSIKSSEENASPSKKKRATRSSKK